MVKSFIEIYTFYFADLCNKRSESQWKLYQGKLSSIAADGNLFILSLQNFDLIFCDGSTVAALRKIVIMSKKKVFIMAVVKQILYNFLRNYNTKKFT
jgi:hypothetical protein